MLVDYVDLMLIVPITLGIIVGIATGMLAGIGIATGIFLLLPILTAWPVSWIIAFYVSVLCVSQYMSSITSLYFAIPGETSSIPAAKESNNLIKSGQINAAMSLCSIGSLLGSLLAISIFLYVGAQADKIVLLFKSSVQIVIMLLATLMIILAGNNKITINILLSIVGFFLGQIGYNVYTDIDFLTFDSNFLRSGIPLAPALVGIWIIPMIFRELTETSDLRRNLPTYNLRDGIPLIPKQIGSIFRGSIVGSFLGLVPGLSFVLSSNAAYLIEKMYRKIVPSKLGTPIHAVVASETANNAGILTMLIPLFLFGFPITISESIIYNLLYGTARFANGEFMKDQLITVAIAFSIASIFAVLASWPFARVFASIYKKTQTKTIIVVMVMLLTVMVIYSGVDLNYEWYYAAIIAVTAPVGFFLRKYDVTPLIFMFIMQNQLENSIYKFIQVHY